MMDFLWDNGALWWGRFEAGSVREANERSYWPIVAGCYVKGNMGCATREAAERIVEEQARSYVVTLIAAEGTGSARREEIDTAHATSIRPAR